MMTVPPRPIPITLNSDDILFFQHIPKTGGLSLMNFLDTQFPPDTIFPLHSSSNEAEFARFTPEEVQRFRLIRGHFRFGPYDNGIYRYITQNPLRLTFLREPVARTVSAYRHQRRMQKFGEETTLEQYVTDPQYARFVVDLQTRLIVGKIKAGLQEWGDKKPLPDSVLVQVAKENLEFMAFVGLTEQYKASFQLLCYTFGWQMPAEIPQLNLSPEPFDPASLPPSTLALIQEKTRLDAELYEFAVQLFQRRCETMVDELFEENTRLRNAATAGAESRPLLSPRSRRVIRSVRRRLFPPGTQRQTFYFRLQDSIFKRSRVR